MRSNKFCNIFGMLVVGGALIGATAEGQLSTPVYIEPAAPILNEWGQVIQGSALDAPSTRPLVYVLQAPGGVPLPPDENGFPVETPFPGGETRIGAMVSPAAGHAGIFSAAIGSPRPAGNSPVYVRVYNAPTIEGSLFYADSMVTNTPSGNRVISVTLGPMTNLVFDANRDSEGRGMPDVWQHLNLGAGWRDINPASSLGAQGMSVRESFIAGLDPTGDVGFVVRAVRPQFSELARLVTLDVYDEGRDQTITHSAEVYDVEAHEVSWWAAPGRVYTLKASTNLIDGPFVTVADNITVDVEGDFTFEHEDVPADGSPVYYRVWVQLAE